MNNYNQGINPVSAAVQAALTRQTQPSANTTADIAAAPPPKKPRRTYLGYSELLTLQDKIALEKDVWASRFENEPTLALRDFKAKYQIPSSTARTLARHFGWRLRNRVPNKPKVDPETGLFDIIQRMADRLTHCETEIRDLKKQLGIIK
jgi:hypothetical protein